MGKSVGENVKEVLQTLKYCIRLSWSSSKRYTICRILCNVAIPLIAILVSFLGKCIINMLIEMNQAGDEKNIFIFLVLVTLILNVVKNTCASAEQYIKTMHDDILRNKLIEKLMEHSMQVDLECFDNMDYYDKLRATVRDIYAIIQVLWNGLKFFSSMISFVAIFMLIYMANPAWVIALVAVAIPSMIASTKYTRDFFDLSMEQINAERKKSYLQGLAMDRRYAQDIRVYNIAGFLIKKYNRLWKEVFDRQRTVIQKYTVINIISCCLPEMVSTLICIDIGFRIFQGNLTVGDYSLYIGLITQFLNAALGISGAFTEIYDNKLRIMNLMKVFNYEKKVLDKGKEELEDIDCIEFKNVSFCYPNAKEYVFQNLSFFIDKKQKTVFVGKNGSGKSTIIKLLLRMYDPTEGEIKINKRNIKEYTLDSIRNCFSVYLQNMENYSMSLRDNVVLSDMKNCEDDEKILEVLKKVGCDDILKRSDRGLDAQLTYLFSEDGIELSGGQNQRLAIARTIFKQSCAVILDEPSSNLDPETEYEIFNILKEYSSDKLTIFTSHRLNNVVLADRIIVLEDGKIVEDGSHMQLLEKNQRYATLFKYQQSKYGLQNV